MSAAWEPPGGPGRVVGGLLGVAGGETIAGGCDHHSFGATSPAEGQPGAGVPCECRLGHRCEPDGPVTAALVDLCHSYVARRGRGVPVDVAERHGGVAGPGWLLAVAVVRSSPRDLVADTLELAAAAGAPAHALGDYVAYVELAAGLLAGRPAMDAVAPVTERRVTHGAAEPQLCGESGVDALAAGTWALSQPGDVTQVLPTLAARTTPSVAAAAAGLLGLRDGCDAVPMRWQRRLRSAATCLALAPGLVRARCRDHLGHVVVPGRRGLLTGAGAS